MFESTKEMDDCDCIDWAGDNGSHLSTYALEYFTSSIAQRYNKQVHTDLLAPRHGFSLCDSYAGRLKPYLRAYQTSTLRRAFNSAAEIVDAIKQGDFSDCSAYAPELYPAHDEELFPGDDKPVTFSNEGKTFLPWGMGSVRISKIPRTGQLQSAARISSSVRVSSFIR
jgi:hypothetical protein